VRDNLGDRMKTRFEDRTRHMLPRRTYTIIRCDGKAFHTYTRACLKPFDESVELCMDAAALALVKEAQGAVFAYIQSDEISVLLTDFARPETDAWFDGNLQKICSVAASVCTMAFNANAIPRNLPPTALFDARVFVIPDPVEVENYFIWRQKDAERNSLSTMAQQFYSHKELQGKSSVDMHEMLHRKDANWNWLSAYRKRGRMVIAKEYEILREIPVFTKDKAFLTNLVPRQWADNLVASPPSVADVREIYKEEKNAEERKA